VRSLCEPRRSGESCGPGNGRRTPGGGEKVSHKGWPAITGILWKVDHSRDTRKVGGGANDELLGHHGSDRISGAGGNDVLWGDWDPRNNRNCEVIRHFCAHGSRADGSCRKPGERRR
jgi:Ca2+-binding RTX toxin-like protein